MHKLCVCVCVCVCVWINVMNVWMAQLLVCHDARHKSVCSVGKLKRTVDLRAVRRQIVTFTF
jgi:hypothetical protein